MASLFWAYAHDRLRWLWIFRPGPLSALVRGIAGYLDDIREDVIWTRNQYLASLAIKDLMPGYAQSRAVPRTRYDSDEQHRTRVVRAYAGTSRRQGHGPAADSGRVRLSGFRCPQLPGRQPGTMGAFRAAPAHPHAPVGSGGNRRGDGSCQSLQAGPLRSQQNHVRPAPAGSAGRGSRQYPAHHPDASGTAGRQRLSAASAPGRSAAERLHHF